MSHHNGEPVELVACRSAADACREFQAEMKEINLHQEEVGKARVRLKDLERSIARAVENEGCPILCDGMTYRLDYSGSVYGERVVDAASVRMSIEPPVPCNTASDAPDLSEAPC